MITNIVQEHSDHWQGHYIRTELSHHFVYGTVLIEVFKCVNCYELIAFLFIIIFFIIIIIISFRIFSQFIFLLFLTSFFFIFSIIIITNFFNFLWRRRWRVFFSCFYFLWGTWWTTSVIICYFLKGWSNKWIRLNNWWCLLFSYKCIWEIH